MLTEEAKNLALSGAERHREGKLAEALALYQQADALCPGDVNLLNAIGNALYDLGRVAEALQAFNRAAKAVPRETITYRNMARVFVQQLHYAKAEICYRQGLSFAPGDAEMWRQLAKTCARQDKEAEAHYALNRLESLEGPSPILALERLHVGRTVWESAGEIDRWREETLRALDAIPRIDVAAQASALYASDAGIDFRILCHGRDNLEFRRRYAAQFFSGETPRFRANDSATRRVGIFVSPAYENVFLKMLYPMLERWEEDDIELHILCSAAGREKYASVLSNPRLRYLLIPKDLPGTVRIARDAALDMVYFWEVGSNAPNYFLPMLRLAPLQCTGWGSVESTGLSEVDYFLSSRWQEGDAPQAHHSEKLHLLEHFPTCFRRPPERLYQKFSRRDFGFSEAGIVYALPHHAWKIHPDMDAVIAELLAREPRAEIALVESVIPALTGRVKARLERAVPPAHRERLKFVPYQGYDGYLSLLSAADAVLDTFHYSGGQTSMETFGAGTPVVTLPGAAMRGRSTHGLYRRMGLEDAGAVADAPEDYVARALALADAGARSRLREQINATSGALYDNPEVGPDHARFFREAIDGWRSGAGAEQRRA